MEIENYYYYENILRSNEKQTTHNSIDSSLVHEGRNEGTTVLQSQYSTV